MEYVVRGSVNVNYEFRVKADSIDEAREKAEDLNGDLGISYLIDGAVGIDGVDGVEFVGDDDNFEIYEVEKA